MAILTRQGVGNKVNLHHPDLFLFCNIWWKPRATSLKSINIIHTKEQNKSWYMDSSSKPSTQQETLELELEPDSSKCKIIIWQSSIEN